MACSLVQSVQSQTTTWNGHTYQVVWFKDVFGREPVREIDSWWLGHEPSEHAATKGGHVLTITSTAEEQAIQELWTRINVPGWISTSLARISIDRTTDPLTILWETGEKSSFHHELLASVDFRDLFLSGNIGEGHPMQVGGSDGQQYALGADFYILEKDPVIDTDGDGIPDNQEHNTRHHYRFVQCPIPWTPGEALTSGWSFDECKADALALGGHLLDLGSVAEHHAVVNDPALDPWVVGMSSHGGIPQTPLLQGGVIETASHAHEHFIVSMQPRQRFSTYILEVEDSTDPTKADTDGDGHNDGVEAENGSNPLDPSSIPDLPVVTVFPSIEVEIMPAKGRHHQVQTSTDLINWVNLGDVFYVEVVSPMSVFVKARDGQTFVRVLLVK